MIEESVHDIAGATNYLKSIGKNKIILQGHSLGCMKVVNYLLEKGQSEIKAAVLIAPTPPHLHHIQPLAHTNHQVIVVLIFPNQ